MTTAKRESDFRSHTNFLLLFALFFGLVPSAWADSKENSAAILELAKTHCFACHNPGDPTAIPGTPRLEGQLAEFLVLQLQNYRIGERPLLAESSHSKYPKFTHLNVRFREKRPLATQHHWLLSADTVEKLRFEINGDFICDLSVVLYSKYEGVVEVP